MHSPDIRAAGRTDAGYYCVTLVTARLPKDVRNSEICTSVSDAEIIVAGGAGSSGVADTETTQNPWPRTSAWKGLADMNPRQILGIPIIEEAAPVSLPQQERELHSTSSGCHRHAAVSVSCRSLNHETTLRGR